MYTYLLQDWVTIRSASTITVVNQTAEGWLDLSGFQDLIGWVDVKGATLSGGTAMILTFQTAPTKDETLMATLLSSLFDDGKISVSAGVKVAPILLNNSANPSSANARWLRWQLSNTGPITDTWDATFRIFMSANAGGGGRKSLGGMAVAPSARAGMPLGAGTPGSIRTGAAAGLNPSVPLHLSRTTSPSARAYPAVGPRGGSSSVPLHLSHTTPPSARASGSVGPRGGSPSVPLHLSHATAPSARAYGAVGPRGGSPSVPLHLSHTTPPSARAYGAVGPRGGSSSVPLHLSHTTPSSSGPHGPVGPGGPSVPLHLKPTQ